MGIRGECLQVFRYARAISILQSNCRSDFATNNFQHISLDSFDRENYILTCPNGGYKAWLPDELKEGFLEVAETIPSGKTQARQATKSSSGFGAILKIANIVLNTEVNAANAGNGGAFNNVQTGGVDFTQGLQNQTWSAVDAAANWNVQ